MAKFEVLFETTRTGTLKFEASDTEEAIEIYQNLLEGSVYMDDLEGEEETEDSDTQFMELRTSQGKLLAD